MLKQIVMLSSIPAELETWEVYKLFMQKITGKLSICKGVIAGSPNFCVNYCVMDSIIATDILYNHHACVHAKLLSRV